MLVQLEKWLQISGQYFIFQKTNWCRVKRKINVKNEMVPVFYSPFEIYTMSFRTLLVGYQHDIRLILPKS